VPRISAARANAQRERILDAALTCFAREGFHAATMQDIVTESGLSPGAIYGYFKGKTEVVMRATFKALGDGKQVVGFFSLTVGQVQPEDATVRLLKGQPADRPVPVVILARLAVDRAHQGKDLGRSLLQEAMLRFNDLAEHAGVRALAAHALDEQAKAFYLRFGFDESPTDPLHLILLAKDLNRFLDQAGGREGP